IWLNRHSLKTLRINTRRHETFYTIKEKQLKCSSTTNRIYNIFPNGGNSFLAKVKEKIKKEFSRRQLIFQPTSIHLASISKKDGATCLKPCCTFKHRVKI